MSSLTITLLAQDADAVAIRLGALRHELLAAKPADRPAVQARYDAAEAEWQRLRTALRAEQAYAGEAV